MLTISSQQTHRTCAGRSRRDFLRIGSLALAGLSLPQLLAARSEAAMRNGYIHDRAVVLLFLSGGPSHIEFFDPKMTAPAEIRSITGEVTTTTPGVTFGGTFEKLAAMTDQFSVVRSFGSRNGGHTYEKVASGENPLGAAMSAIYARVAGTNDASSGMPNNVLVVPEAVKEGLKLDRNFETGALPSLTQAGSLGQTYAAFDPSGGGPLKEAMQLRMPAERLGDRRNLLAQLDAMRRHADKNQVFDRVDRYQTQAFDMITKGIAEAFDLSREDPRTIERYDTSGIFHGPDLQRYYDMRRASNLLGRQMLLARRLCEAGCGFVTVSDCGWDMHANNNSPKGMTGIWPMGRQVDHAVSAFIQDVKERGLSDKILLVVTGEMGRTPRINNNGGRDHYGELTPLLFSGGGLNMGQVIGQSDNQAGRAITDAYTPKHMMSTIMQSLFDVGKLRLDTGLPRDLSQAITSGEPIPGLV